MKRSTILVALVTAICTTPIIADTSFTGSEVEIIYGSESVYIEPHFRDGLRIEVDNGGITENCPGARIDVGYRDGPWLGFIDTPTPIRASCRFEFESVPLPTGYMYVHQKWLDPVDNYFKWYSTVTLYHNTFFLLVNDDSRVGQPVSVSAGSGSLSVSLQENNIPAGDNCHVRILSSTDGSVIGEFDKTAPIVNFDTSACFLTIPLSELPSGNMKVRFEVGQQGYEWMGWRGEVSFELNRSDDIWFD